MKNFKLGIVIIVFLVIGYFLGSFYPFSFSRETGGVACTMDAKECPDGSFVGRIPPKCDFAPCPEKGTQAVIAGRVVIGPLCPVEPCRNQPNPYLDKELIFKPKKGNSTTAKLEADGSFQKQVEAGIYSVELSQCQYLGCRRTLPKTVEVKPGETVELVIEIDTGIR